MTVGNQTLLLSGSLLSNAATELAQTLRSDLVQLLDQPISNLSRYGLSDSVRDACFSIPNLLVYPPSGVEQLRACA